VQNDSYDGLRIRQQHEGLRVEHPRQEQDFDVIAESMDLSCGQRSFVEVPWTAWIVSLAGGWVGVNDFNTVLPVDSLVALAEKGIHEADVAATCSHGAGRLLDDDEALSPGAATGKVSDSESLSIYVGFDTPGRR
jgi:hypothetical protein